MGSPSSSCWHCPTLPEELLRTDGIQPLSSHTPGPSDCSDIASLLSSQSGALLQCYGKGLNEKENKANTGHFSTCLNLPINLPLHLNLSLMFQALNMLCTVLHLLLCSLPSFNLQATIFYPLLQYYFKAANFRFLITVSWGSSLVWGFLIFKSQLQKAIQ